jgi:DNA repair exonuclease SbcCD ATPase subunit
MEEPHLSSQLDYLEQKLQEANTAIARLQQRIESQEYAMQEQGHRIAQLEGELTQANAELARAAQFDDKLAHQKDELLHLVERRTNRAPAAAPEGSGALVTKQLENHTIALNEMRRTVEKTARFDEQIAVARTETTRLNQEISKLQAKQDTLERSITERTTPLAFIEEQRRTDLRKLTEIEAQLPELLKKIESNATNVKLVSQQVPQFAKYEAALETIREEIRGYREHMDYQLAQRERQIKDWNATAQEAERRVRAIESAMEKYTEFYQLNKRALSSLQDFQERLQRDQHRFGELQRLAEERQRTETEKFRAEFEQRWQKQSMEMQPQFEDFQRNQGGLQKRIDQLAKLQTTIEKQLNLLMQIIEEDVQTRAAAALDWQQRFEQIAEEQE